ncbi:methyl-accepting chemotaxis protein [Clostridium formicaceticum]|uniref:Methyl-accepting chemotaxis protein McpB n=1 Tax=Clostridium formicaceticum TaxID=1497 RepID=A0AAC9RJL7_9CLOT|nr:methyl-accepting chemotaxis protein [Clostridium formicaceticum]AOY76308.1 hypothetical protein BJL90_10575 [Clostridium formicaceticum]ARE86695.1 Methyl-accepting chemotaxis protein McpB [Clostridium formicaceticum]
MKWKFFNKTTKEKSGHNNIKPMDVQEVLDTKKDQSHQQELLEVVEDITQLIRKTIEKTSETNGFIAQQNNIMVQNVMQESAALQEADANVNEVVTHIENISHVTGDVAKATNEAFNLATQGNDIVASLGEQMQVIDTTFKQFLGIIDLLKNNSKEIEGFTNTIQTISSQTNLLSLNASIEAARAGEHGRGFAVVANEVKKLSEETVQASSEINQKIQNMTRTMEETYSKIEKSVEEIAKGMEITNLTESIFDRMLKFQTQINDKMNEIWSTTEVNSNKIAMIAEIWHQISKHAMENAASMEQLADKNEEQTVHFIDLLSFVYQMEDILQDLKKEIYEGVKKDQSN